MCENLGTDHRSNILGKNKKAARSEPPYLRVILIILHKLL